MPSEVAMFKRSQEFKTIVTVRALGADISEEFVAFREAQKQRRMLEAEVDSLFFARGWK